VEVAEIVSSAGILTKPDILAYLRNPWPDRIIITPLIDPEEQIGSSSVDLRLGCELVVPRRGRIPYLRLAQEPAGVESSLEATHERIRVNIGERYVLHHQQNVLTTTLEYIGLPRTLAGLVVGRSSWERVGLNVRVARIPPGWRGCISLQLVSHTEIPIELLPGARICQLLLLPVSTPVQSESHHDLVARPGFSRILVDRETRALSQGRFPLILGVVGTLVSGKSEITERLIMDRGFLHLSLATIVREETKRRGLPTTANNLQNVGNSMRQTYGSAVLVHRLRPRMEAMPGGSYLVLTGIKNIVEVRELRKWPNFVLLAVDASPEARFDRARQRGRPGTPDTEAEFRVLDERDRGIGEMEWGQQVDACIEEADFVLDNNSSLDELHERLEEVLESIFGQLERLG
jgi:dCTP deaminase